MLSQSAVFSLRGVWVFFACCVSSALLYAVIISVMEHCGEMHVTLHSVLPQPLCPYSDDFVGFLGSDLSRL